MVAEDNRIPGTPNPRKFFTFHYLSFTAHRNIQIGLFESVMHARQNGVGQSFDAAYLNPLIFYRAVEQDLGDADNVILGIDARVLLLQKIRFYSQFILDEFRSDEIFAGNGWRGNKWAYQAGLWYYNIAGLKWLDGMVEYNRSRPYMYTHFNDQEFTNYQHYQQPLAHPLGANFEEILVHLIAKPSEKVTGNLLVSYMQKGEDQEGRNFGGNILLNYAQGIQEYGNFTLQGNLRQVVFIQPRVTFKWKYGLNFDFSSTYRLQNFEEIKSTELYFSLGLRANFDWKPVVI
jgi:hypothetical protein